KSTAHLSNRSSSDWNVVKFLEQTAPVFSKFISELRDEVGALGITWALQNRSITISIKRQHNANGIQVPYFCRTRSSAMASLDGIKFSSWILSILTKLQCCHHALCTVSQQDVLHLSRKSMPGGFRFCLRFERSQ
ncbi:hypothetical protein PINS_up020963, partial [Pythium insidiosum]